MALFQTTPKPVAPEVSKSNEIAAKIQQRRYQILVHSLLYYELDTNLVSDSKWSEWALELAALQKANPDVAKTVVFADAFKDFDGSSGFDLPYKDEQIVNIAYRLLKADSGNNANALNAIRGIRTTRAEYGEFYSNRSNAASKRSTSTQRKVVKKVEPVKRKKLF